MVKYKGDKVDNKHEYEEYYIAFIDVLGFKELLTTKTTCEDIYSIFEHLQNNSQTSLFYNGEDVASFAQVKHYIMSDSIVLYIKADIEEAFLALLVTCLHLQASLLYREKPILLRGGIAKGELFVEDHIIFGKGLSEAYQIENSVAIYPRIVFNKELIHYVKKYNESSKRKHWDGMFTRLDDDEFFFVHYISPHGITYLEKLPQVWNNVLNMCQAVLDCSYSKSIREKYLWLKKYVIKEVQLQKELLRDLPNGKALLNRCGIHQTYTYQSD